MLEQFITILNILFSQHLTLLEQNFAISQQNSALSAQNSSLLERNNNLQDRITLLERQLFGSKSEQQGPTGQPSPEPDTASLFDTSEADELNANSATKKYTRPKSSGKRRPRFDTSSLPQRTAVHDLPADQKSCATCHKPLEHIDDDTTTQLETIPAQHILVHHVTPQYACRCCNTIVAANKEPSIIPKAMVGNSVLTAVIVGKYVDHLPIYRQAQIYTRFDVDDITSQLLLTS